jgi:hypothetical protein
MSEKHVRQLPLASKFRFWRAARDLKFHPSQGVCPNEHGRTEFPEPGSKVWRGFAERTPDNGRKTVRTEDSLASVAIK